MSKKLNPSLRGLALQIALQLPDDRREAISVLRYAHEIVERGPEKLGHAVRTSDIGVVHVHARSWPLWSRTTKQAAAGRPAAGPALLPNRQSLSSSTDQGGGKRPLGKGLL